MQRLCNGASPTVRENGSVELSGEDFASDISLDKECLGLLKAPRRVWSIVVPMERLYVLNCCSSVSRTHVVQLCGTAERWPE